MSETIAQKMRTLLSEADSGAMGWKERLDAAMELVAEAWDEGSEAAYYDPEIRGFVATGDNPYLTPDADQ